MGVSWSRPYCAPSGSLPHSLAAAVASRRRGSVARRDPAPARAARFASARPLTSFGSADGLRPTRTPSSHAHSLALVRVFVGSAGFESSRGRHQPPYAQETL